MLFLCHLFSFCGHGTEVRGFTLAYSFHQSLLYCVSQSIFVANNPSTSNYLSCHSCIISGIDATSTSEPTLRTQPSIESCSLWEQEDWVAWGRHACLCSMYLFHIIAVTNCYKLNGLKPHRFIMSQNWRSEI